jgi:uncharacterized protein involved in exopolysaccharide biosynthesis
MRELPILGVTYSDLSRQLAMREGIYETLTKQYEIAKVQEAKEIPTIKVLDEPAIAERKSLPHRLRICLLGTLVPPFLCALWILVSKLWEITDDSFQAKAILLTVLRLIRNREVVTPS